MSELAGDYVQVLVDGYELTGDHNRITLDDKWNMLNATAFGDRVQKFIPGQRDSRLEHAGYVNAAVARSHPVLNSASLSGVVSVLMGQNADPVAGDPVYSLETLQSKYAVNSKFGETVPFAATFVNRGHRGGWGTVLAPPTTITNSAVGTAVNHGSASANGGSANLHLLTAAATDRYTFVVQGSSTGAFSGEETTIATFTLDASAVGSERIAITGTIPAYTRWTATRTGSANDPVTVAVTLIRF